MHPFAVSPPQAMRLEFDATPADVLLALAAGAHRPWHSKWFTTWYFRPSKWRRFRLGGHVHGNQFQLTATPFERYAFVMHIDGQVRSAARGSGLEAVLTVPVSLGAQVVGIVVAILLIFFSGYNPIYAIAGLVVFGFPFWLAVVRMNQRDVYRRADEVVALLRETVEDGVGDDAATQSPSDIARR
jgi:hypothetical protein